MICVRLLCLSQHVDHDVHSRLNRLLGRRLETNSAMELDLAVLRESDSLRHRHIRRRSEVLGPSDLGARRLEVEVALHLWLHASNGGSAWWRAGPIVESRDVRFVTRVAMSNTVRANTGRRLGSKTSQFSNCLPVRPCFSSSGALRLFVHWDCATWRTRPEARHVSQS